jgi:hypothetical protein
MNVSPVDSFAPAVPMPPAFGWRRSGIQKGLLPGPIGQRTARQRPVAFWINQMTIQQNQDEKWRSLAGASASNFSASGVSSAAALMSPIRRNVKTAARSRQKVGRPLSQSFEGVLLLGVQISPRNPVHGRFSN